MQAWVWRTTAPSKQMHCFCLWSQNGMQRPSSQCSTDAVSLALNGIAFCHSLDSTVVSSFAEAFSVLLQSEKVKHKLQNLTTDILYIWIWKFYSRIMTCCYRLEAMGQRQSIHDDIPPFDQHTPKIVLAGHAEQNSSHQGKSLQNYAKEQPMKGLTFALSKKVMVGTVTEAYPSR